MNKQIALALMCLLTPILAFDVQAQTKTIDGPQKPKREATRDSAAVEKGVPAQMPYYAQRSGYCCLNLDISTDGVPSNIRVPYCTDPVFQSPSVEAVAKWRFKKLTINGERISWKDDLNMMTFMLGDENGNFLPDPDGLLSRDPINQPNDIDKLCSARLIS